jgi:glycosyltransferase involved in cell wall biosynthesis
MGWFGGTNLIRFDQLKPMSRLIYVANIRLPTEKAHGYQVVQMCEALALAGQSVTLVTPRRHNTPELSAVHDIWGYYGVRANFRHVRLPCLDALAWSAAPWAFFVQTASFLLVFSLWLASQTYERLFSRELLVAAWVALFAPRRLLYEAHTQGRSRLARHLQTWLIRRAGCVFALTGRLADKLRAQSGRAQISVAHDAVRPERFAHILAQAEARTSLNLPAEGFIVCYVGRLHTMGMSKGLETVIHAAPHVPPMYFLVVGGDASEVTALRKQWAQAGLPPDQLLTVGTVPPQAVPAYLASADVCVMPSPYSLFFADETSPMKLFEYMGAGRAILASDLPSTREIVSHGESAWLVPPSDPIALAEGLRRLQADSSLRHSLGQKARQLAQAHTWEARAQAMLRTCAAG